MVVTITSILLGLSTMDLFSAKFKASLNSTVTMFVSDLRQQQLKAMVGDTEGRVTSDYYGIYFEASRYILFHGTAYSSSDTYNFPVALEGDMAFVNTGVSVIFSKVSGELYGASSFTIPIKNKVSGEQKNITINQLGVVTGI